MLVSICKIFGQLIYDTISQKPMAIELLARPTDKYKDFDIPTLFSLIERSSLITWFGHQLNKAAEIRQICPDIKIHINLDKTIIDDSAVYKLLSHTNLTNIVIEVTQLQGLPSLELIKELRKHSKDALICLDDYDDTNSPTDIDKYQFDTIKTDRSFLVESANDFEKHLHFKSIFHEFKVPIIVEGVENYEDYKRAKIQGAHLFQGYYFHKPKDIDILIDLLIEKKYNV